MEENKQKQTTKIYIKNMVCQRCVMAVSSILSDMHLNAMSVELGEAVIEGHLTAGQRASLAGRLSAVGFELLDDRRQQTISRIKNAIIKLVHYRDNNTQLNLSSFLSSELLADYSSLSKLFSEVEGKTIERCYMEQRVERVKELIKYDEMTLTQIALQMNYSSVAYLSSQFKAVTGMTPTQFKRAGRNTRRPLDKI